MIETNYEVFTKADAALSNLWQRAGIPDDAEADLMTLQRALYVARELVARLRQIENNLYWANKELTGG